MALRVVVLMGGVSSEREVSLRSGAAVSAALERLGHAVTRYDVVDRRLEGVVPERFDAAFVALHGAFGEDGEVQRLLEERALAYTGSGPEASALCMDKWASRQVLARQGIRVGVSLVRGADAMPAALAAAARTEPEAVVERYVPGREITMGVLGERVLPPLELVVRREFYDYEAKYTDPSTEYRVDPELPEGRRGALEDAAFRSFRALGCRGMGRVDFRLPETGDPVALEMNTIPGFTDRSDLPMAAAAVGIGFDDLCSTILEGALAPLAR